MLGKLCYYSNGDDQVVELLEICSIKRVIRPIAIDLTLVG